jgi:transcriptional regulator with GAF, ATPase, and Fis domain
MLALDESAACRPAHEGAYFDVSLELLRELTVTRDVDAALPRLSAIVSKLLPHDALRMASFDQQGRPVVTASTADVPDLMAADEQDVVIDDLRTRALGECVAAPATERLVDAGYRSVLAVSTDGPKSVVRVAFWSKRPRAFDRTHVPLARRIAYHLGLGASCRELGQLTHRVDERTQQLEVGVQRGVDRLHEGTQLRVIGGSVEWRDVLRKATQVAATHTTVLITGESGTGKEVVARFIHAASPRKNGPFVALNCAALPEQLLESELFGYERGAFTSAQQSKPGLLELASGGVLFLDEVSEMSLSAQAKFLRVLQEREFQRLGGTRLLKANIRVIAATNRDLRNAAERGDFREDLFYRIGVFDIRIPPLRDRSSDILPLSEAFLQDIGRSFGRPPAGLTRGGATRPSSLRLSRERARASQRSGAGRDPLRRWAHRPEPSKAGIGRQVAPPRRDRSEGRGTDDDFQGLARVPRQQNQSGAATGLVTHAAAPADSKVPTRGECQRLIVANLRVPRASAVGRDR